MCCSLNNLFMQGLKYPSFSFKNPNNLSELRVTYYTHTLCSTLRLKLKKQIIKTVYYYMSPNHNANLLTNITYLHRFIFILNTRHLISRSRSPESYLKISKYIFMIYFSEVWKILWVTSIEDKEHNSVVKWCNWKILSRCCKTLCNDK